MGITNELREWMRVVLTDDDQAYAIADRIDAEHEKAIRELNNLADASMLLPVDADGMPICVGDWIDKWGAKVKVVAVTPDDVYWWELDGYHWCHAFEVHHYHKPTVDDVMVEFAIDWESAQDGEDKAAVLKEYAAKFRLVDDGEEK